MTIPTDLTAGPRTAPPDAELRVSTTLYGAEPVFQAAYKFTDRCYLLLRPDGPDHVVVEFRNRDDAIPLNDLVGLFSNELIDQHLRASILAQTQGIRDHLYRQAFTEGGL